MLQNVQSKLVLDLCAYTLDKAGYKSQAYAFYLQIAFRHHIALHKDKWDKLNFDPENPLRNKEDIESFAQGIVDEIVDAQNENWSIKLLKTSYLNQIERLRDIAHTLLIKLDNKQSKDLSMSLVSLRPPVSVLSRDSESIKLQRLLTYHINYLNYLARLPFMLDCFFQAARKEKGYVYNPKKTTQALTSILNDLNNLLSRDEESNFVSIVIKAMKLAVDIEMPDIDVESIGFLTILTEYLKKIVTTYRLLEGEKANFFNQPGRQALLSELGVDFPQLTDILSQTIIKPVQELASTLGEMRLASENIQALVQSTNPVDCVMHFSEVLDRGFLVCDKLPETALPASLRRVNDCYNQLSQHCETISQWLGAFRDFAKSLLPTVVVQYFETDHLNILIRHLQPAETFDPKLYLAYLNFYSLSKDANLADLEPLLFEAFMQELKLTNADFEEYFGLTEDFKAIKDLETLPDLISLEGDPKRLLINYVMMTFRLQKLEQTFQGDDKEAIFKELSETLSIIKSYETDTGQAQKYFGVNFLEPTIDRLLLKYNEENLVPLLEKLIDQKKGSNLSELRDIYSKLKQNILLSNDDFIILEKIPNINFKEFKTLYIQKHPARPRRFVSKKSQTPKEIIEEQTQKLAIETFQLIKENVVNKIIEQLSKQKLLCMRLHELTSDQKIKEICAKKIQYIESLQNLIDKFTSIYSSQAGINTLVELLSEPNKIVELEGLSKSFYSKAKTFVSSFLFENPNINRTFLFNLLVANDELGKDLKEINRLRDKYLALLDKNPSFGLFAKLSDPLDVNHYVPGQEKILDLILEKIIETSSSSVYSWGMNLVRNVLHGISKESLLRILPKPFLVDMALQLLQSQFFLDKVTPLINNIIECYGPSAENTQELIKEKLYPLLGIEISKTVQQKAFEFAQNNFTPLEDCDALLEFYFEYREIKKNNANKEEIIEFLFSELLEGNPEKNSMIGDFIRAFDKLDTLYPGEDGTLKDTLALLLSAIADPIQLDNQFIQVAIFNCLLLKVFDTAPNISSGENYEAIARDYFKRANALELGDAKKMLQPANKRIFERSVASTRRCLENTLSFIENEIRIREGLLQSQESPLGKRFWRYEYSISSKKRIAWKTISVLLDLSSTFVTWAGVITPFILGKGAVNSILIALGLTGVLGASATGIGIAVFAGVACVIFAVRLFKEFRQCREKNIKTFGQSFFLALGKTIFSDLIFSRLSDLFDFKSVTKNSQKYLSKWPKKEFVQTEQAGLIEARRQLLEVKKDLVSSKPTVNREKFKSFETTLKTLKANQDAVPSNDARRHTDRDYKWTSYQERFDLMIGEIETILIPENPVESHAVARQMMDSAQAEVADKVVMSVSEKREEPVSDSTKLIKVDLSDYLDHSRQQQVSSSDSASAGAGVVQYVFTWISGFKDLFRGKTKCAKGEEMAPMQAVVCRELEGEEADWLEIFVSEEAQPFTPPAPPSDVIPEVSLLTGHSAILISAPGVEPEKSDNIGILTH